MLKCTDLNKNFSVKYLRIQNTYKLSYSPECYWKTDFSWLFLYSKLKNIIHFFLSTANLITT